MPKIKQNVQFWGHYFGSLFFFWLDRETFQLAFFQAPFVHCVVICFFHVECFTSPPSGWYICIMTKEELVRWRRKCCWPWYWWLRRRKNCWFRTWMDYWWLFTISNKPYLLNLITWNSTTSTVTFCCTCSFPLWLFFFPFFVERFVCLVCLQLLVTFCYGFLVVNYNVAMVVVCS